MMPPCDSKGNPICLSRVCVLSSPSFSAQLSSCPILDLRSVVLLSTLEETTKSSCSSLLTSSKVSNLPTSTQSFNFSSPKDTRKFKSSFSHHLPPLIRTTRSGISSTRLSQLAQSVQLDSFFGFHSLEPPIL